MNTKILTTLVIGLLVIAMLFAGCSTQTEQQSTDSNAATAGQNTASTTGSSADSDLALVTPEDTEIGAMI